MLHRFHLPLRAAWITLALLAFATTSMGQEKPAEIQQDANWQERVPALKASFAQQLRADQAAIYAMSREERQQYVAAGFQSPDRATRRAFKLALEEVRQEWDIVEDKPEPPADNEGSKRGLEAAKVAGTNITYDTGTVTGGSIGTASQMVGNRFNTGSGLPVETSGSITQITFDMVVTFFGSAVWSLYTDIVGTMADQVTSMARPGIMTGLNTLAVMSPTTDNAYMNGTFLAGIWQFDPTMTGLAYDTGSTNGQGFHGISLNDAAVGTMLNSTVTAGANPVNFIFRVSGDVVTPIELMDFTIEDAASEDR